MSYNHQEIEKKWQARWEADQHGRVVETDSNENALYYLIMFPYPSGSGLHVGHVESQAAIDILARMERMRGKNVLCPIGYDAFGLPAENYAIKTGVHPSVTTKQAIENFHKQMQSLGLSFDWSREISTADPEYYKWTQWLFLLFYKNGLAYRKKSPVNWCDGCHTVLANEQVVAGACERCGTIVIQKDLEQWFFNITKYADRLLAGLDTIDWPEKIKSMQRNWIGKSVGAEVIFQLADASSRAKSDEVEGSSIRMEVVFASNNKAKKARMQKLVDAAGLSIQLKTPEEIGILDFDVVEDGLTLTENSEKKARALSHLTSLPILADDSGFFIENSKLDPVKVKRNALDGVDEKEFSTEEIGNKMLTYYQRIATDHGGRVDAEWRSSLCLMSSAKILKQEEAIRPTILTNEPHGIMDPFMPLRPLYISKDTNKYVLDQTDEEELIELKPIMDALTRLFRPSIRVFTTRPDTLFGATYLVLAPEHQLVDSIVTVEHRAEVEVYRVAASKKSALERTELQKEKTGVFTGAYAINPVNGEAIPVWIADYVITTYGTGAIMAVPAHDERDFEFAKKYQLPTKIVVASKSGEEIEGFFEEGVAVHSEFLSGLSTSGAKQKMIQWLEENHVGNAKTTFRLRDWLVSRQRYWGAPIPIIWCEEHGAQAVEESQLPVELPTDVDFKPTGESPLVDSKTFHDVKCPKCGKDARRESDTMDTFVDSSWYYLRYTDPHNAKAFADKSKIDYWCPVDLYLGGAEHAVMHLLYARFFAYALHDLGYLNFSARGGSASGGEEPFLKLKNQGLILGPDGDKMSKSKGNVVNPDEIVSEYGADSIRLYEMFMGPLEDAKPWDTKGVVGVRRFLDKVWKLKEKVAASASSQAQRSEAEGSSSEGEILRVPQDDAYVNRLLHKTIKKVTKDLEDLKFNTAISQLMIATNEFSSVTSIEEQSLESLLKLLAPFAPHIAEELWGQLGHTTSIFKESWPTFDPTLIVDDVIEMGVQVNGKVRATIHIAPNADEASAKELALSEPNVLKWIEGKDIVKIIYVPGKIFNIVV